MTKQLIIDGLNIELVRSKRRTLGLELSPSGLKARAPTRMTERDIIAFIKTKRAWIEKHLQKMPTPQAQQSLQLIDGAELRLRGQAYQLRVVEGSRANVAILPQEIVVPVNNSHTPLEKRVKNKLVRWYKHVAQHELQTRARHYAHLMGVPQRRTDQIYVRDYKRRWGSCDSQGKLSFNWRILQAPTAVSDYVVVHELAHCHEFNHSRRFWAIVANQMADYKTHEDWLNRHGYELYQF